MPDTPIEKVVQLRSGLTDNQRNFAEAKAKGATNVDAYKIAYSTDNMKRSTVQSESSRAANHPKIKEYIKALEAVRHAEEVKVSTDRGEVTMEWVMSRLREEADDQTNPATVRVTALKSIKDSLEKRLTNTETRTVEEMEKELMRRLAHLTAADAFDA